MAKYGKKAQAEVHAALDDFKHGELTIGSKGPKVKSRKQAIAIGLSQARKKGDKVPPRPGRAAHGRKKAAPKAKAKRARRR